MMSYQSDRPGPALRHCGAYDQEALSRIDPEPSRQQGVRHQLSCHMVNYNHWSALFALSRVKTPELFSGERCCYSHGGG